MGFPNWLNKTRPLVNFGPRPLKTTLRYLTKTYLNSIIRYGLQRFGIRGSNSYDQAKNKSWFQWSHTRLLSWTNEQMKWGETSIQSHLYTYIFLVKELLLRAEILALKDVWKRKSGRYQFDKKSDKIVCRNSMMIDEFG